MRFCSYLRVNARFLPALINVLIRTAPPPPARLARRSGARDARHPQEPRPRARAARRRRRASRFEPVRKLMAFDRVRVGLVAGTVGAAMLGGCYFIFSFCVMDALNSRAGRTPSRISVSIPPSTRPTMNQLGDDELD